MTMTVALAATVSTGCGQSQNGGAKPLEENPTPVHRDGKEGGAADAVTKTEGGIPKSEVMSLPKDFALEYTTKTAGVRPSDERFIRVQPDKSGGFLLTAGTVAYEDEGRTRTFVASVKKRQTEERCLNFYNEARKAGFFGLKDKYEEMEFGGIGTTVKITANGSTKTVHVYGTRVEEFDLVVSAIQALSR
jgi:hypothetical protein